MGTVLVLVLLVLLGFVAASVALGRTTERVESARDTEYVELEGAWIRYTVVGGGPPVVLVHGWLASSRIWEQLAGRLAQRFTVYTLDLNGFGESDKPLSGYGIRNGSRLLYAFCAHFGLQQASVIGHDIGGAMALKLAADHPDLVGHLVLVATPADEEQIDLPTPLWLATLPVVGAGFYGLGRLLRPVRRLWVRPFVSDPADLPEEVVEDAGRSVPAAVSKTISVMRREITRGRLSRQARMVRAPLLAVAGEDDQIVDPESAGVWSRSVGEARVWLVPECGHLPMVERPEAFNAQVLAFLTGDNRYLDAAFAPERGRFVGGEVEDLPQERTEPRAAEVPEPDASASDTPQRRPEPEPPEHEPIEDAVEESPATMPEERRSRAEETRGGPSPLPGEDLLLDFTTRPESLRRKKTREEAPQEPSDELGGPDPGGAEPAAEQRRSDEPPEPRRPSVRRKRGQTSGQRKPEPPEDTEDLFDWPEPRERGGTRRDDEGEGGPSGPRGS